MNEKWDVPVREDVKHFFAMTCGDIKNVRVVELLERLGDRGFSWSHLARMCGVSLAQVQRWRIGEIGPNHIITQFTALEALCVTLENYLGVDEPAGWFETPLLYGVAVTPLDLMTAGRVDLVLAAMSTPEPDQVLAAFDPDWRETRTDQKFEVFTAGDGIPSIRPRA